MGGGGLCIFFLFFSVFSFSFFFFFPDFLFVLLLSFFLVEVDSTQNYTHGPGSGVVEFEVVEVSQLDQRVQCRCEAAGPDQVNQVGHCTTLWEVIAPE